MKDHFWRLNYVNTRVLVENKKLQTKQDACKTPADACWTPARQLLDTCRTPRPTSKRAELVTV